MSKTRRGAAISRRLFPIFLESRVKTMSIREEILGLIGESSALSVPVTEKTDLYRDLHLDSLSFVCLLVEIESRYHVTIELPEMQGCRAAGQLAALVEAKRGEGSP